MPSTKDPTEVVQPGPGRLPASTVPASALIYPPGGGSDAALQAHITDPVGAHAATAISTTALGPWADGTPNTEIEVQAALADFIDDLTSTAGQRGAGKLTAPAGPAWLDTLANPAANLDVRLNKIITDLIANQGSNRTGQPGFTGETWSVASGPLSDALTRLFEGTNARPTWVLDANPAEKADFVGPNALINAIAAISTHRPILFLRAGVYNWNDSVVLDRVTIRGADRDSVQITNGAGNLRCGDLVTFENLSLVLTGDLDLSAGILNSFRTCSFSIAGDVKVSSYNIFENITGVVNQYFDVAGFSNQIRTTVNCQIKLQTGTFQNTLEHIGIQPGGLKDTAQPVLLIEGSWNRVLDVLLYDIPGYNVNAFHLTSTAEYNQISTVTIYGMATPGSSFRGLVIEGDHNIVDGYSVTNTAGTRSNLIRMFGDNNIVRNTTLKISNVGGTMIFNVGSFNRFEKVYISAIAPYAGSLRMFEATTGADNVISNFTADGTTLLSTCTVLELGAATKSYRLENIWIVTGDTAAKLALIDGTNNTVDTLRVVTGDINGPTFEAVKLAGQGNSLRHLFVEGILSNTGSATAAVVQLTGIAMDVNGLEFENIGTGSDIVVPLIELSGGGVLQNIKADGTATTIRAGRFIDLIGNTGPLTVKTCLGSIWTDSAANAFHAVGINSADMVYVLDCTFIARGDGAPASSATVFVQDCASIHFQDVTAYATEGRAGAFPDSSVKLSRCSFIGGDQDAGAGRQLFYGYGRLASIPNPLILQDCYMEYGSSNCQPSGIGNNDPIVFFGGVDDVVTNPHGTFKIDGLVIKPGSSVTYHDKDSVLVVEDQDSVSTYSSSVENLTIDLNNIEWDTSGNGRGTLYAVACVIEAKGGTGTSSGDPHCIFKNVKVLNCREGQNNSPDRRGIIEAQGCDFDGIVIEGSTSGHTAGNSFERSLLNVRYGNITNVSICRNASIIVTGAHSYVYLGESTRFKNAVLVGAHFNTTMDAYLTIGATLAGDHSTVEDVLILNIAPATLTHALVYMNTAADRVHFIGNRLLSNEADCNVPFLKMVDCGSVRIRGNYFRGPSQASGHTSTGEAIQIDNCSRAQIIANEFHNVMVDGTSVGTINFVNNDSWYCVINDNIVRADLDSSVGWVPFNQQSLSNYAPYATITGNIFVNEFNSSDGGRILIDLGGFTTFTGNVVSGHADSGSKGTAISESNGNCIIMGNSLVNRGASVFGLSVTGSTITQTAAADPYNKIT